MSVKTAAFLALVGTILLTLLLVADFIRVIAGIGGLVPGAALLRSSIYVLASLGVVLFLYIFNKHQ